MKIENICHGVFAFCFCLSLLKKMIDTALQVLVPLCRCWYHSAGAGTALSVLVPGCRWWYRSVGVGITLLVLVPLCRCWYRSVGAGTALSVLVPLCRCWYRSVGAGTTLPLQTTLPLPRCVNMCMLTLFVCNIHCLHILKKNVYKWVIIWNKFK